MNIIFIVDFWEVSSCDSTSVEHPSQVAKTRRYIRRLLVENNEGITKFKFVDRAIYQRFSDLEGGVGVTVNRIIPQVLLGKLLNEKIPDWLDNSTIVDLGLLNARRSDSNIDNSSDTVSKIIKIVLPNLLMIQSLTEFYDLVHEESDIVSKVFKVEQLYLFVLNHLEGFWEAESVKILLKELAKDEPPVETLVNIGKSQVVEKARQFVQLHEIPNVSFSPRKFDKRLLENIPTIIVQEVEASDTLEMMLNLLENVEVYVTNDQLDVRHLAEIIVPWPSFLEKISNLIEGNPKLATTALKESLNEFDEPSAVELREKIIGFLNLGACDPLQEDSSMQEALVWCREYLTYAKHCFLQNQEPETNVSDSFTRWFLAKRLEVKRSNYDWSIISEIVENNLNNNKLVVFCVVDALSAIHLDLLRKELDSNLNGVIIEDNLLFAPIPTITEVGKMAVVTGKNHYNLPSGSQESIIQHRYERFLRTPDSLLLLQSWKDFRDSIGQETQFIVCFENRIDERLHGCVDFKNHQKDVQHIVNSLVKDINSWLVRAAQLQKEIEIIISADHGSSCITRKVQTPFNILSCSERVCKYDKNPENIPVDLEFIEGNEGSDKGYIVPLNRTRFAGENCLVHGGLTAEEVLIPFVLIKKGSSSLLRQPLELFVEEEQGQIVEDGWQINLSLVVQSAKIEKVYVLAEEPFSGREGPIGPIHQHRKKLLRFMLRSNIEQSGLLNVPFLVDYQLEGECERQRFETELKIRLPATLLEKDKGAQSFDDMFA